MKPRHLTSKDYTSHPWRNGQGTVLSLATDFQTPPAWSISRARLDKDAQFSNLPGYERQLVLLSGGPITLFFGGERRLLSRYELARFSGEDETEVKVRSPGEDLSVLTRRGNAKASVFIMKARDEEEIELPLGGNEHFIHVIEGELELEDRNVDAKEDRNVDAKRMLLPLDLYWCSRPVKQERELLNLRILVVRPSVYAWVVIRLEE